MRALLINRCGSTEVLEVREVPRPRVDSGQVLIEVHASSVNPIDGKIRDGSMAFRFGRDFPKQLGFDASGVIVEVAEDVQQFEPGDQVYVRSDAKTGAACAEYLVVSAAVVALRPQSISHQQAAAIPLAALTALQGLRDDCHLQAGQRVLIIGASGGVGTFAVQIAKVLGAHVTAVCSTANLEWVAGLGADCVIDYSRENVFGSDRPYDCIYDVVGSQRFGDGRRALIADGHFAAAVPSFGVIFGKFVGNLWRRQKAHFVMCKPLASDLAVIARWVERGAVRSVIDSTFALEDIALAHKRMESKRSRGKIVIAIKESEVA